MPENANYIVDSLQEILDNNKGFIAASSLAGRMSPEFRKKLGVKSSTPTRIIMKMLEPVIDENFFVRKKGNSRYIMIPQEPEDFVLAELSESEPVTPTELTRTLKPFTKSEVIALVNELSDAGRVLVKFKSNFMPELFLAGGVMRESAAATHVLSEQPVRSGGYTLEEFKAAYDELHKFRDFPRVPDLRRKLNWPREVFDEMVRTLRDSRTVQLIQADQSTMTKEEYQDCFVDERNLKMGLLIWND